MAPSGIVHPGLRTAEAIDSDNFSVDNKVEKLLTGYKLFHRQATRLQNILHR